MAQEEHHGSDYVPLGSGSREQRYARVMEELEGRLDSGSHPISNSANLLAILKQEFNWWWVGYYWVVRRGESEFLALGQFQGPPACTKLFKGVGVCGTAWRDKTSIVLEDVDKFPGHIACSSASKSEIVIPILEGEEVVGVLDIDAANYGEFSEEDEKWLRLLVGEVGKTGQWGWFRQL